MKKNSHTDVVIIGAGPTGLFGIFQCGMLGLKTHVFDSLPNVGGQCSALYPEKNIYDIPAYTSISAQELVNNLLEQAKVFSPKIHLGHKVIHVEKNRESDYLWKVTSDKGKIIKTKAILIAAGVGIFSPKRLPIKNIDLFEEKYIHYFVRNKDEYKDKNLIIAGGGDSAVDWALALYKIASRITVVHRRNRFRASPHNENLLKTLAQKNVIDLIIPYQLHELNGGDDKLENVVVQHIDNQSFLEIKADFVLPFFGLSMNIEPILQWGLDMHQNNIKVDMESCSTNRKGIYAIGDIVHYTNKLKLILTGFSEAAYAAHAIYKQIYPNKPLHFEHSTTKGPNLLKGD